MHVNRAQLVLSCDQTAEIQLDFHTADNFPVLGPNVNSEQALWCDAQCWRTAVWRLWVSHDTRLMICIFLPCSSIYQPIDFLLNTPMYMVTKQYFEYHYIFLDVSFIITWSILSDPQAPKWWLARALPVWPSHGIIIAWSDMATIMKDKNIT